MKDTSACAACAKGEGRTLSTRLREIVTRLRTRIILREAMTIGMWSLYCGYGSVKKPSVFQKGHEGQPRRRFRHSKVLRVAV